MKTIDIIHVGHRALAAVLQALDFVVIGIGEANSRRISGGLRR